MRRIHRPGIQSRQLIEAPSFEYQLVGRPSWLEKTIEPEAQANLPVIEINQPSDLDPILHWLKQQTVHGIDVETSGTEKNDGLDPLSPTSEVVLFQYGTAERVYLIDPGLLEHFRCVVESEKYLKVGQNLLHDFKFLLVKHKLHILRRYDTMLGEQLLTAGLSGTRVGLEDLVRRYPPHYLISKQVRKQFVDFNPVADKMNQEMLYYAASDIFLLFPIMEKQILELKRWKMVDVMTDECDLIPVTAEMELTGVLLHAETLRLSMVPYEKREKELRERIFVILRNALGVSQRYVSSLLEGFDDEIDLDSPAQKMNALKAMGIDVKDVKRETLQGLEHEIGKLLGEYSNCRKMLSTYGENLLNKIHPATGRFHPQFHQLGAGEGGRGRGREQKTTIATGRYSSDFQQIPRPQHRMETVTPEDVKSLEQVFNQELQDFHMKTMDSNSEEEKG